MREPSANGTNGRETSGRFAKGNPGGPGNPFARRVAALRSALLAGLTEDDLRELVAALLAKAKGGDLAAAKLLLDYAVGKPRESVDPDRLDAHEFAIARSMPTELDRQLLEMNRRSY